MASELEEVEGRILLERKRDRPRFGPCRRIVDGHLIAQRAIADSREALRHARLMGEAAVDLPDSYFDAPKAEYLARRDLLVSRLNKMPGVFCPNPGGAFYAIAKLPIDDSDKFCQWLLESFSYKDQTVMLAPATGFYGTAGLGKNEVRLAYVLNLDALNAAMDCLEKALEQYPGRVMAKELRTAAAK